MSIAYISQIFEYKDELNLHCTLQGENTTLNHDGHYLDGPGDEWMFGGTEIYEAQTDSVRVQRRVERKGVQRQ